ncbi:MAG TPA: GNAT family protein [Phycisphaerales bacterium]|nr:GNAT family protein [Phycisphaerales bacterium]
MVQPTQEPSRAATAPARPVEVLAPRTIVTRRLVLRALAPGDRAAFTDLLAHSRDHLKGRINVHAAGETDAATFDRLLAATESGEARGSQWRRAAFLPTGQPVGMVHVLDIQRGMAFTGDAGWWVAPFHCGNGIATEIVAAMLRHALADLPGGLGLHTVYAAITPHNTASQRVAAKAGFRTVPGAVTSAVIDGVHEPHQLWEAHVQPLEAKSGL